MCRKLFFLLNFSPFSVLVFWLSRSDQWGSCDKKHLWFLRQAICSSAQVFECDKREPHSKFPQQFTWPHWQIQVHSQLIFSQCKLAVVLIISSHPHMYLRFASDKAAEKGINIWLIKLFNNQGEIRVSNPEERILKYPPIAFLMKLRHSFNYAHINFIAHYHSKRFSAITTFLYALNEKKTPTHILYFR